MFAFPCFDFENVFFANKNFKAYPIALYSLISPTGIYNGQNITNITTEITHLLGRLLDTANAKKPSPIIARITSVILTPL